ncbi:MAG: amino acid adenylation domain-containing protein, partial [Pyrinomonadaceae bacterium]
MGDIAARVMNLSPEKLRLLAQQLKKRQGSRSQITRQSRESNSFPLSFAQQRMWVVDQMSPGNTALNISLSYRFDTRVDLAALEKSFNLMVQRHEVLRTTFESRNGVPVQVIAPSLEIKIPLTDLTNLPVAERESVASRLAAEESRQPFDLSTGPLIRASILKLGEQDHVLLWSIHHIVFDGSSGHIFEKEQVELYEAILQNRPLPFDEPPIQYVDYATWQRELMRGETLDRPLSFWKNKLADAAVLNLPTDHPRPTDYSYRGKRASINIPEDLARELNAMSRRMGVTLFTTLLAAFKLLLSRYTGQSDVVLGTPISNRNHVELEEVMGLFVNTLVLRTDLSGDPPFAEFLGRVHKMWIDSFAHQDMPFEELVKALNPGRDLSHQPIFQVMFHFNTTPLSFRYQDDQSEPLPRGSLFLNPGTALFDLTFSIEPASAAKLLEDTALNCVMEYSTDLFEEATIDRMLDHYLALLQAIVRHPEQHILDIPLMSEGERNRVLVEFNDTDTAALTDKCIPQLFEEQVEATPDNIAVLFENQRITYSELNDRANQLAHYLRQLGIGPDALVGVHMERSPELIVAILGILKAGGAYAPLDPALPAERLAFMLDDLRAPVVLTRSAFKDNLLAVQTESEVLCLDSEWEIIARESEENIAGWIAPENLAYVIYTSGSTGRIKGVLITHGAIAMHSVYVRECYQLEPTDRALQFFQINLDGSLEQICSTLIAGAGLVLRDAELWTPTEFQRKVAEFGITVINPLPAYMRQVMRGLIEEGETTPGNQLKLIMIGGDAMLPEDIHLLRQSPISTRRLMHCYGPTEATIYATNIEIPARIDGTVFERKVPIGRPVDRRKVYILDTRLNPVSVGVPGELYIGGEGLARGYLNRPDLTAEKFIPDPFSREPGARIYSTGDRARYLPDGSIEFLGRFDHQVKIRGYRIELGEIEAALADHPSLRDVLVVAREDAPGNKRLLAYAVTNRHQSPTNNELRAFLRKKLPDYMVPSAFVMLDAFPLTPSGKVDRQALPDFAQMPHENGYIGPRTPIEDLLVDVWARSLGVDKVGIHDNFFELGGDSILAIQIVAKANQSGIRITQRQIFRHQTIAELAEVTGTIQEAAAEQGYVSGKVPLTPIQCRFFERNLIHPHHFNQVFLFESERPLDSTLLGRAVGELMAHHDALRLRFVRTGTRWQQFNTPPDESVPLTFVDLSALPDLEQEAAVEIWSEELQASLNLADGPIVRVGLFDLGPQKPNRLLIIIHHLVVDIVSWPVILEDLSEAYRQLSRGDRVRLPAKTTSFKRWAELLVERSQSAELDREGYWLDQRGVETSLPVDHAAGENDQESARTITVELDEEETGWLLRDAPKAYRTQVSDILLTALATAFANWTGDNRLLLDLEAHGREEGATEGVDLSRTVGWFTSLYPVVLTVEGEDGEALKGVKEKLRKIPGAGGEGYGLLRYLSGRRDVMEKMSALPQAEVSFNYFGQLDQLLSASPMFKLIGEPGRSKIGLSERRAYLLEVNGWVTSGRLQMTWTYSQNRHRHSTIEALG